MINAIPIFGWFLSFALNASLAVPFWICWTCCGIGRDYFYFLPERYHAPGFWACVGLFIVIGILKGVLLPGALVNSSSQSGKDSK